MGERYAQGNGGDYSSDDDDSETEEYAMDKSQIDPMIGEKLNYLWLESIIICLFFWFGSVEANISPLKMSIKYEIKLLLIR